MTTKDAEKHRQLAAEAEASKQASWERSDTDGFLSQWASGLTAREHRLAAEIIDNGNVWPFKGLYQGDRRVAAKIIHSEYAPDNRPSPISTTQWLLSDSETDLIERRGKRYLPSGSRSRILKSLGLSERGEIAPAKAGLGGKNTWSMRAIAIRDGCPWGSDATLSDEED